MSDTPNTAEIILQVADAGLALWSDEKKEQFIKTFEHRARVSRYILLSTAFEIGRLAVQRKFITHMRAREALKVGKYQGYNSTSSGFYAAAVIADQDALSSLMDPPTSTSYNPPKFCGGRSVDELDEIAEKRAVEVIAGLPPLSKAVRIIDPDTAAKIDRKDKLVADLNEKRQQYEALSVEMKLSDWKGKTVDDFLSAVDARVGSRKRLRDSMEKMLKEAGELDGQINEVLYKGLPGLSDAVFDVIRQHVDKATGLDAMTRRVGEQVRFGDNETALEILKTFESDELKIRGDIKEQFDNALEKLQVLAKKGAKAARKAKP